MSETQLILAAVGLFLGVTFALDAIANFKIIRLLETENKEETQERTWHL